jgi:hypothetical protein
MFFFFLCKQNYLLFELKGWGPECFTYYDREYVSLAAKERISFREWGWKDNSWSQISFPVNGTGSIADYMGLVSGNENWTKDEWNRQRLDFDSFPSRCYELLPGKYRVVFVFEHEPLLNENLRVKLLERHWMEEKSAFHGRVTSHVVEFEVV